MRFAQHFSTSPVRFKHEVGLVTRRMTKIDLELLDSFYDPEMMGAPVKPQSSFNIFVRECGADLKQPGSSGPELIRYMLDVWENLGDSERSFFESLE